MDKYSEPFTKKIGKKKEGEASSGFEPMTPQSGGLYMDCNNQRRRAYVDGSCVTFHFNNCVWMQWMQRKRGPNWIGSARTPHRRIRPQISSAEACSPLAAPERLPPPASCPCPPLTARRSAPPHWPRFRPLPTGRDPARRALGATAHWARSAAGAWSQSVGEPNRSSSPRRPTSI